jgi:hypothetical protein
MRGNEEGGNKEGMRGGNEEEGGNKEGMRGGNEEEGGNERREGNEGMRRE